MVITTDNTFEFMRHVGLIDKGTPLKWIGANGWLVSATALGRAPNLRVQYSDGTGTDIYVEQIVEFTRDDTTYRNLQYYDLLGPGFQRSDQDRWWKYREAIGAAITFVKSLMVTTPDMEQAKNIAERELRLEGQPVSIEGDVIRSGDMWWEFRSGEVLLVEVC